MKLQVFISSIVLIFLFSCNQTESEFPQGAWSLVQGDAVYGGDSVVNLFPSQYSGNDVKIWSERHYNYVGQAILDTDTFDHFGGGTYTIDGNRYIENIVWDYKKDAVGNKVKMLLDLQNDTLIQIFPIDDNWQKMDDFFFVVKYIKLD